MKLKKSKWKVLGLDGLSKLCLVKGNGGLGLRKRKEFNKFDLLRLLG